MLGGDPKQAFQDVAKMKKFEEEMAKYKASDKDREQVITVDEMQQKIPEVRISMTPRRKRKI